MGGLKESLKKLAGAPLECNALVVSQASSLLKLAASCLFRACKNLLTTDMSWPSYQQILSDRADRTGNYVTVASIRERIFQGGWSGADVAEYLAAQFVRFGCDGLFLPVVDHLGIRLPIDRIVRRIRASGELRFVMLDAAQAFCHVELHDAFAHADFIVAGSQKWMGGYLPLGIAFFGHPRSRERIERRVRRRTAHGMGDPLCQFVEHLATKSLDCHAQTVSLPALFTAAGAARDQQRVRRLGTEATVDIEALLGKVPAGIANYRRLAVVPDLQTRVAIVQHPAQDGRSLCADGVRRQWLSSGCIVTGYDGGYARLSFGLTDTL